MTFMGGEKTLKEKYFSNIFLLIALFLAKRGRRKNVYFIT